MTRRFAHYLNYQHNVQRFFQDHINKYDGVIIPFSIAISFEGGTYGFIRALCALDPSKTYCLDPRTALYQKDWSRHLTRPPHEKVAMRLGAPFSDVGLERPLKPNDFDDGKIRESSLNCLDFQRRFRHVEETNRKLEKYRTLLGADSLAELKEPQHLIPPYFQNDLGGRDWRRINQAYIEEAARETDGVPIRPVHHFGRWAEAHTEEFLQVLRSNNVKQCYLYPNLFKEHEATKEDLEKYRSTIERCSEESVAPYALLGGYFSILLAFFGLHGVGNGVGYGEWRDSAYHKGGVPSTRIYIYPLHRYVGPTEAQQLVAANPDFFMQGSDILRAYFEKGLRLTDIRNADALNHFLECRKKELELVNSGSVEAAVHEIDETLDVLDRVGPLERKSYGNSLATWAEVLLGR